MADGFPDSGNPDDYEGGQLEKLAGMEKDELTKNQRAAVARWKFANSPAAKKRAEKEKEEAAEADEAEATEDEEPKEDPERVKRREAALEFDYVQELKRELGDDVILDTDMQLTKPYVLVEPKHLPKLARYAKDVLGFGGLLCLTAADYPPDRLEVVYNFYDYDQHRHLAAKARVPREGEDCAVASITDVYVGADWLEREVIDMFGIRFPGHPYPKRLLLPEGWVGHPLRKDYDLLKEQYVAMDERGDDVVTFEQEGGW